MLHLGSKLLLVKTRYKAVSLLLDCDLQMDLRNDPQNNECDQEYATWLCLIPYARLN